MIYNISIIAINIRKIEGYLDVILREQSFLSRRNG